MLAFTPGDIIFHKLLELHSPLSETKKKIFLTNFPFSTDSLKPLHPLNEQNPLSVTKVFCRCSLMAFFFSEQETPRSFLSNGAKLLRFAHEHLRI